MLDDCVSLDDCGAHKEVFTAVHQIVPLEVCMG